MHVDHAGGASSFLGTGAETCSCITIWRIWQVLFMILARFQIGLMGTRSAPIETSKASGFASQSVGTFGTRDMLSFVCHLDLIRSRGEINITPDTIGRPGQEPISHKSS